MPVSLFFSFGAPPLLPASAETNWRPLFFGRGGRAGKRGETLFFPLTFPFFPAAQAQKAYGAPPFSLFLFPLLLGSLNIKVTCIRSMPVSFPPFTILFFPLPCSARCAADSRIGNPLLLLFPLGPIWPGWRRTWPMTFSPFIRVPSFFLPKKRGSREIFLLFPSRRR